MSGDTMWTSVLRIHITLMRIRVQILLKQAHILYILACHLQIDADPEPDTDPAYHFDADPDPTFQLMRIYADLDPEHCIT